MEPVLLILIGVISLIVNIVLIYHFIVMCKSVKRIADKLAPEEDDNANANNSGELSTTSRVVVIGLVLILIVLAYFFYY